MILVDEQILRTMAANLIKGLQVFIEIKENNFQHTL